MVCNSETWKFIIDMKFSQDIRNTVVIVVFICTRPLAGSDDYVSENL